MKSHYLTLFIATLSLSGCGLFGKTESKPQVVKIESSLDGCEFPSSKTLTDRKNINAALVKQASDCLEAKINSAFRLVHGTTAEEISLEEIKTLKKKGFVKLPIETPEDWELIGAGLTFFHPKGHAAVSKKTGEQLLAWMRANTDLYVKSVITFGHERKLTPTHRHELLNAFEDFLKLVSPYGQLTLDQAMGVTKTLKKQRTYKDLSESELRNKIEAVWKLKALAFEDPENRGGRANLTSSGLKKLLELGIKLARKADLTVGWLENSTLPQHIPKELPQEWRAIAEILKEYFTTTPFTAIDTEQIRWSLNHLIPKSGLAELAPDLVRISQRLLPEQHYSGLHPLGLVTLLDQIEDTAQKLVASAPAFGSCENSWDCSIPLRNAYQDPLLKLVALKGELRWPYRYAVPMDNPGPLPLPKRLDIPHLWISTIERFIERGMVKKIFDTFDSSHTGYIALSGSTSADTRDAMDLAFTFLRFAGAGKASGGPDSKGGQQEEQSVSNPILIKPSALYRVMGLVGNRWMPDGSRENSLNADEFFSVVKIYQDIQSLAESSTWSMYDVPAFTTRPDLPYYEVPGGVIFSRKGFIQKLHKPYQQALPYMYEALETLSEETRQSLFHALIGVPDSPIEVYPTSMVISYPPQIGSPPIKVTQRQYVHADAALGPAAILSLIERLMINCDQNEDNFLNWKELDCAMPLILGAGLQTVSSELVDLDPGVHDGSKILLNLLNTPGVPLTIAKLIAINGAVREVHLPQDLLNKIENQIEADWTDIARFIGAPVGEGVPEEQLKLWILEASRRYGHCDRNGDGKLTGRELDCFVDAILEQTENMILDLGAEFLNAAIIHGFTQRLHESPLIRIGIKIATQPPERLLELLDGALENIPAASSSPAKILNIIEESIRRSEPLCQLPDC